MKSVLNIDDILGLSDNEKSTEIINIVNEGTTELNLSQLVPFFNHPFKLYEGDRLNDMVESIREHGIIMPLIVRLISGDKYEILSGHNRANASKIAGLETVPVVIKDGLTDEEAMLIVTETNLIQRSFTELSHSEKARILTERHNAIKQQGRRIDLINEVENLSKADDLEENSTLSQFETKLRSDTKIGNKYDLSRAMVSRYLRIDTLIDELKDRLDNNEIPFMAAVDLSFLNESEQEIIEAILDDAKFKVDLKKSELLKTHSKANKLEYDKAYEILSGKIFDKLKANKKPKFTPKFTKSIVEKYVTENRGISEVENLIEELLQEYFAKEN